MTQAREERLRRLRGINRYFGSHATHQPGFVPELEASGKILIILEQDNLSDAGSGEVERLLNEVLEKDHYDGSGWLDFRIRLFGFVGLYEFEPFRDKEGKITVRKNI